MTMTLEHKRKIGIANSVNMKRLWSNPEYKEKMSEAHRGNSGYWLGKNRNGLMQRIRKLSPGNFKHGLSKTSEYRVAAQNKRRVLKLNAEGSHTLEQWENLKIQHKNQCVFCGEKKKLTIDHIKPLTKGGSDNISNIQPLCKSCNSKKGNKYDD